MKRKIFILIGPPGSGKGTQAEMLSEKIHLPILSTGQLLRQEKKAGTRIGKQISKAMDAGDLVPHQLVFKLLKKRSHKSDAHNGFIIDGFPRDKNQLVYLNKIIKRKDKVQAILIEISDKEAKLRISGRRVCGCGMTFHIKYNPPKKKGVCDDCGSKLHIRNDDKPKVVVNRLVGYRQRIKAVLQYFSKKQELININGEQSIIQVHQDVIKEIKKFYDQIN